MKRISIILCCILIFQSLSAKILVIALSDNPDDINGHYRSFNTFCTDPFDYIIINKSSNSKTHKKILSTCTKLGISCFSIDPTKYTIYPPLPDVKNNKVAHEIKKAKSINYALKHYGYKHNDIVALIDTQVRLVKPFSIIEYMKEIDIAAVTNYIQGHGFFWSKLVFLRMNNLHDKRTLTFDFNHESLRAGFYTYYYMQTHPHVRFKEIDSVTENLFLTIDNKINPVKIGILADQHFMYSKRS